MILAPFLLGAALAYLLNPLVALFEARGWRRDRTVIALYLLVTAALAAAAFVLVPRLVSELSRLQSAIPAYLDRAQALAAETQSRVFARWPAARRLAPGGGARLLSPLLVELQDLPGYALRLLPALSLLFLVPFVAFFVLMDSRRAIRKAIQLCPSRHVEQALYLLCEIDATLGNYLRGVLVVAAAIAIASFAGLAILGIDYALAIAALAGALSVVPYAGSLAGMAAGAFAALVQFKSAAAAGKVVLLFLGIRLADDLLLEPTVSRHSIRLHPLLYLFALTAGGELFGFAGLVFAVPAACVLKVLLALAWDLSWGSRAPLPLEEAARIPYL